MNPKFKVGDLIRYHNSEIFYEITEVTYSDYTMMCRKVVNGELLFSTLSLKANEDKYPIADIDFGGYRKGRYRYAS